jgi:hypothetical protein
LAKARERVRAAKVALDRGGDPAADQKATRRSAKAAALNTVETIGGRYFLDAPKGRHRQTGAPKGASTVGLERYYFDRHARPCFGAQPIGSLTRLELQGFVNRMADEHLPSTARQCRVVLQRLLAFAHWQEITDANPCQHIHEPRLAPSLR